MKSIRSRILVPILLLAGVFAACSSTTPTPEQHNVPTLNDLRRPGHTFLSSGFLLQDDPTGLQAVQAHGQNIDIVYPDWFTIRDTSCTSAEQIPPTLLKALQDQHVAILPRVSNGENDIWHAEETKKLLHSPQQRTCLAESLAKRVSELHLQGLNVDLEELTAEEHDVYGDFLSTLADKLHAQHAFLIVDTVPDHPAFDLARIANVADGILVMTYDEHADDGPPGPLASLPWVTDIYSRTMKAVPAQKLLMGIGAYGYDWNLARPQDTQSLPFPDIAKLASTYHQTPKLDAASQNMTFSYTDPDGSWHDVWYQNGPTMRTEWHEGQKQELAGFGMWRLGTEDPSFWTLFPSQQAKP